MTGICGLSCSVRIMAGERARVVLFFLGCSCLRPSLNVQRCVGEVRKPEAKPGFDGYVNCGSVLQDVIIWMHDTGQHPI